MSERIAVAIVPVRIESQRLPNKALLAESGQPLFLHTWSAAAEAMGRERAFIATDSDAVDAAARDAGATVIRTSRAPRTGSERCAEALRELDLDDEDIVVNVQGDWPEIPARDLASLTRTLRQHPDAATATLCAAVTDPANLADHNVVKVVRSNAENGGQPPRALYFSRAAIPFRRETEGAAGDYPTLRHIGVYAFRARILRGLSAMPSSGLAELESLEQLKLLENGVEMAVLDASGDPWGIETRADYDAFLQRQQNSGNRP